MNSFKINFMLDPLKAIRKTPEHFSAIFPIDSRVKKVKLIHLYIIYLTKWHIFEYAFQLFFKPYSYIFMWLYVTISLLAQLQFPCLIEHFRTCGQNFWKFSTGNMTSNCFLFHQSWNNSLPFTSLTYFTNHHIKIITITYHGKSAML